MARCPFVSAINGNDPSSSICPRYCSPLIHFVQQVAFVEILTFFIWRRNILNSYSTLSQFTFYREFHLRCICHFWRDSAKFVHPGKETFISLAHIRLNQKRNHFALFVVWYLIGCWIKVNKEICWDHTQGAPSRIPPSMLLCFLTWYAWNRI